DVSRSAPAIVLPSREISSCPPNRLRDHARPVAPALWVAPPNRPPSPTKWVGATYVVPGCIAGATLDARAPVPCALAAPASTHAHVAPVGPTAVAAGADVDMYSAIVIGRLTGGADCPIDPILRLI